VKRQLVHFGAIFALILSGWGSAFVALACAHAGCQMHAAGAPRINHTHHPGAAMPASHCSMKAGENRPLLARGSLGEIESAITARLAQPLPSVGLRSGRCDCIGRPEAPETPAGERMLDGTRRDVKTSAPGARGLSLLPLASSSSVVVPLPHAPPGRVRRHIVISVFLI
jgi:hypothetical protein